MKIYDYLLGVIRVIPLIAILLGAVSVNAEVPHLINYQGRLTNDAGPPFDTVIEMTFKIYGDTTGAWLCGKKYMIR